MIKSILFDLDGTLLPMDQEQFIRAYFKQLSAKMAPYGYNPEQLVKAVWAGTAAMVQNDGSSTNEAVFWKGFSKIFGDKALEDQPLFDAFYREDFEKVEKSCGKNPAAAPLVRRLKKKGYCVALATNPIFPAVATESRIRWAGLQPSDFAWFTAYENAHYCKPNLNYYREILQKLSCRAEECLMVGNDVAEDMVAENLGMQVFLLTDCMINQQNQDISGYPQGDFAALEAYIQKLETAAV